MSIVVGAFSEGSFTKELLGISRTVLLFFSLKIMSFVVQLSVALQVNVFLN
jgi:hypothetical protein